MTNKTFEELDSEQRINAKLKWSNENIMKTFRNKNTGETATFTARSDTPSVSLVGTSGDYHFCIGSLNDDEWEAMKVRNKTKEEFECDIIETDMKRKERFASIEKSDWEDIKNHSRIISVAKISYIGIVPREGEVGFIEQTEGWKLRLILKDSFEEQFPSLKGRKFSGRQITNILNNPGDFKDSSFDIPPDDEFVPLLDIQQHCLDKQIIKDRIKVLESMGTICHQWNANELRTLINYWENRHDSTKAEKDYASNEVRKIINNFKLDEFIDKQKVRNLLNNMEFINVDGNTARSLIIKKLGL